MPLSEAGMSIAGGAINFRKAPPLIHGIIGLLSHFLRAIIGHVLLIQEVSFQAHLR